MIQATISVRLTLFHHAAALDTRLSGWYELNGSITSLFSSMEHTTGEHGMAFASAEFAPGSLLYFFLLYVLLHKNSTRIFETEVWK